VRVPLSWLREWVQIPTDWDVRELAARLTQAGFEVEAILPAANAFTGVVIAKILSAEPHPQTSKLQVCRVSLGAQSAEPGGELRIVCGAPNARAGLVSALATVGARLPGEKVIERALLRGVESQGMLCAARELGLGDDCDGILELPEDAALGIDLRRYLNLDDPVLEINVTPNRGDAMSILGIAREVAALADTQIKGSVSGTGTSLSPSVKTVTKATDEQIRLQVEPNAGAARLLGRVVRGVDNTLTSPLWLRERLRRTGLRSISPLVDVTNYVMLELGQPLHAYDLSQLQGGLSARRARAGERMTLLDGREVELDPDILVIADDRAAVGMAGVMGGAGSAISAQTREVLLEAAWFKPEVIAGRARRFGLFTDAGQRFERGVDWRGQERALALAKRLILDIAGGTAGPVITAELPDELPKPVSVSLRYKQLERLLGSSVAPSHVEQRLRSLGLEVSSNSGGWSVQPPSWRFDIAIEADLIEEVGRIGGLDAIDERAPAMTIEPRVLVASEVEPRAILRTLAARGYQEVITFGFVDPLLQRQLSASPAVEVINPISTDLAVMRNSLWPGLISVARTNLQRQQTRVRVFEIAHRFLREAESNREQKMLAGLVLGSRLPEQWGAASTPADFFDVKGDLQSVFELAGNVQEFSFESGSLPCLHPGRSARIVRGGIELGYLGELHPNLVRELDLTYAPILFELDYLGTFGAKLEQFREVSRFPQIRRDISVTVPEQVAFAVLRERVSVVAGDLLKHISAFDLYQGKGVEIGRKSVALGLILQDLSRTLTDEDADRVVHAVLTDLQSNLDARIRE
jgi:phenylalanyl-tRNA synthetase beta chain